MSDLIGILRLWRNRGGWMAAGIALSLAALVFGLLLMTLAGRLTAAAAARLRRSARRAALSGARHHP
jgi:hypothetical protein